MVTVVDLARTNQKTTCLLVGKRFPPIQHDQILRGFCRHCRHGNFVQDYLVLTHRVTAIAGQGRPPYRTVKGIVGCIGNRFFGTVFELTRGTPLGGQVPRSHSTEIGFPNNPGSGRGVVLQTTTVNVHRWPGWSNE